MVIIETKEITPFFTDRGTLVCSSEEIKEKLDGIELLFRNCNDKLAEAEMSACDYAFQADAISTMTENMQKLYLYASRAHEHVSEALDYPLYLHFKTYATETITSIMLNEITTDNTFHLTEYVKIKRQGQYFVNKRVKDTLTMEDFLGLQEITPENGMPILENMETISEFASLFRKDYATMNEEGESLQQYLEKYVNTGDIEHKGYHPLADMLSGIADITIVKPVIECVTGKDMITGEHLTEYDLTWKKIGIIIDLFTLGQGSLAIEGADTFLDGLKLAGKTFALDAISTTASYGAAYIGTELGLSEENILLLSLLTGCTVSVVGGKVLLKDSGGTTKTLSNEQVDEILKGSTGSVEEVIESGTYSGDLMSAEEAARYSEHWRELGIGSDNTWKAFKDANPNGTIDDYFEIVQKQSPWPLGETGTPTTLKAGDRFFMAVENNAPENVIGGFGVKERIDSTDFVRNNLAVKYDWKTSCNVIREFEVNSGIELNVNAGPVGPQIDLGADLYLPGDTTITQYDLFSNLGSGIKREDYVHIVDEYWVD